MNVFDYLSLYKRLKGPWRVGLGRVFRVMFAFFLFNSSIAQAGNVSSQTDKGMNRSTTALETAAETPFGFSNGSVVVAPIPLRSPTFGTGLILGAGYLFKSDTDSNTSFLGVAGLRTSNGTQGYGFGGRWYSAQNRWNTTFFAGQIDAFYDAYVLGVPIPVSQSGTIITAAGAYGFSKNISVGLKVDYLDTQIAIENGGALPPILDQAKNLNLLNVALTFAMDYRDDSLYPTNGSYLNVSLGQSQTIEGATLSYQKALVTYDYYFSGVGPGVIAARLAGCAVSEAAPFFDQCSLGGSDAFRGYDIFESMDDTLLSLQLAYRGRFSDRFGYSVFGGIGNTAASFDQLGDTSLRYAGGVGLRYQLSKTFPMDIALDLVRNRDGDNLTYIYVGQRF